MAKTFKQMVDEAKSEVAAVKPEEVQQRLKDDPNTLVIDVREPSEIEANGKIPSSVNVPLGVLPIRADQEVNPEMRDESLQDRSQPVIMTCGAGGQAALGAKTLKDMGFENVQYIEGGLKGWKQAGLPTE